MTSRLLILAAVSFVSACAGPPPPEAPAPVPPRSPAAARVGEEELRADLFAFAADSFRGRESGTRDALRAAEFLSRRLREMGRAVEPGGDSGFFQRVPLVRQTFTPATRFAVRDGERVWTLRLGTDLVPMAAAVGTPMRGWDLAGDVVFLGYGPGPEADDGAGENAAEPLRDLVRGRVAVVLHGLPAGADSARRSTMESPAALAARLAWAERLQPSAVIVLMTGAAAAYYDAVTPELLHPVLSAEASGAAALDTAPRPVVLLGIARQGTALLPDDWRSNGRPRPLNRRFEGHVELAQRTFTGYNVVAMVRGTDARLRASYVAYGAHYDGSGIVHPQAVARAGRDTIANGADDDGSGTVALLAIARRMAAAPPRRSVLFVWHGAEEKGLLGSSYFIAHPPVPLDSIVAEVNADMIGRNAPRRLFVIGPRAAPNGRSRALGAIVDSSNKRLPEPFDIDRSADVAAGGDRVFERSDHFNYAQRGIPVVLFTTGTHGDYHAPGDEPRKIDYEKLSRVTRLLYEVGIAVANRGTRPD